MTGSADKNLILDPALRGAPEDASVSQRRAADPSRHVWVRASAGSGKTKVLVDRLLRLLLPDPVTGAPGTTPDKILCLTYTKAGAAEMSLRLQRQLLEWSAMEDAKLGFELNNLLGQDASTEMLREARRLFARVLDAPARLRVLTIHSFCQSVLGRFPIETGLSPNFKVIEEAEAAEFLTRALHENLERAIREPDSDLGRTFSRLAISKNKDQLQKELKKIIGEPLRLQAFLEDSETLEDIKAKLGQAFGISNPDDMTEAFFCRNENLPRGNLKQLADMLEASTPGDKKAGAVINDWLSNTDQGRLSTLSDYLDAMGYSSRSSLKTDSTYLALKQQELDRYDLLSLAGNIRSTADLLYLARLMLAAYDRHKKFMGVMDYNDLIFNTSRLLSGGFWKGEDAEARAMSTAWVLYKLDEGIDHILVDESQDTNPDQWDIVTRLTEEYFSGDARRTDRPRTLFVVGDEKQSIFSFQRADPAVFHQKREEFSEKVRPLQTGFEESLVYSFRTTAPVLKLTDATFDDESLRRHIGIADGRPLRHISFRTDKKKELSGSVELWQPVIVPAKASALNGWELPFAQDTQQPNANQVLASKIARHVKSLIDRGEAKAGDIMILMRTRSPLMLHIIRELKNPAINLPVSGIDRMILSDSLIVQDILSVCDFVLLTDDSFALASLLKSPFVGISEDELMALALPQAGKGALWAALKADPRYDTVCNWLNALIGFAASVQPYEFLEKLLTEPCPADPQGSGYRACMKRLGADTIEPLDEILGQALKLELQEIRTLQDFVFFQKRTTREIKREMEEAGSEIRIMTVHASKGLEAPVVILPDTMAAPTGKGVDTFMWPDKSGLPGPLWAESEEERSGIYERAYQKLKALQLEESSRLLYVAITRAKDKLIVCGASTREKINENSWYKVIESGFTRLAEVTTLDNGDRLYSLGKAQVKQEKPVTTITEPLPSWATQFAPSEDADPESFAPSKQENDEQAATSPLDATRQHRFRRGLATHKLLQILPDLRADKREEAARRYVERASLGLPEDMRSSIVAETMNVLNDPVFAPVFGPGSLAEVPVTGKMPDGRLINGQIDRLVITPHEILIVDFKTNRPSPKDPSAIPASYRAQLQAYAAALSLIYPDRPVKCALLWTDQPLLMPVSF